MKRKTFRSVAAIVLLLVVVLVVLPQIVPERTITVDVFGKSGATITARVTVDGATTTIEKSLPARFEYQAKTVLLEIVGPQSAPDDYIEATLRVNDVEQGMCRDLAVRVGYKGPGLLGLGNKKSWCSGITPTELAN